MDSLKRKKRELSDNSFKPLTKLKNLNFEMQEKYGKEFLETRLVAAMFSNLCSLGTKIYNCLCVRGTYDRCGSGCRVLFTVVESFWYEFVDVKSQFQSTVNDKNFIDVYLDCPP